MKKLLTLLIALTVCLSTTAASSFVGENKMKDDLLQMLADFTNYMKNDFQDCVEPNSIGEVCGCFKGENTMANDERGVRPNADLGMICAFLVRYGKGKVTLPDNVTWDDLETMAMKSLVFSYSTHKANKLKVCKGNNYWGSMSNADHVWESSLWAMSVAYSAFFQWDRLSNAQKNYIYELLKAECNYELERDIPTGYAGDTKAEENGWEADVLAVSLGLFPNDPLAPRWFERLREFAINSYSQKDDAKDNTIIDPDYDQKTVKDLYKGQNLYDDYTLQNHNYFHTSYQNVVIQELGEAALAMKLFQQELFGNERWKTNTLMHNNDKVMKEVLYWLALSDGELAMPNGNDWSLFLYDQITSYSTNACFLRDPHALMLENLAYQMIKDRQKTTAESLRTSGDTSAIGSWLLRADVGARRMGVEAHRVMMTWLMHEMLPTADLTPTSWDDFNRTYSAAKILSSQNIVRASTDSRFTCFSWSTGLKSYTGYIAPHPAPSTIVPSAPFAAPSSPSAATTPSVVPSAVTSPSIVPSAVTTPDGFPSGITNLIVPFRANNTGNFLGWYEVQGKRTNATPVISGIYDLRGNSYVMNGELNTNDGTLNNRFAIYSTPGNAVIYIDNVRANSPCTITAKKGGLMAISVDEFTKTKRTLYTQDDTKLLDGTTMIVMTSPWVNVDNILGMTTFNTEGTKNKMAFGERANNNSVMTAKLYALYDNTTRTFKQDDVVDKRAIAYYSNVTAEQTARFATLNMPLAVAHGWNGVIACDPDSTRYMLLSNFSGNQECQLSGINMPCGAPVFTNETSITAYGSSVTFATEENHSVVNTLKFFIKGQGISAVQEQGDSTVIYVYNNAKVKNNITVTAFNDGQKLTKQVKLSTKTLKISISRGKLLVEK